MVSSRLTGLLSPTLSIGATGNAAPALVWQRYTRPALWSSWSPQIAGVNCSDPVIRAGSTGTVLAVPGALGLRIPFRVLQVDEQQYRWSWEVSLPVGVRLHLEHTVGSADGGTRTGLAVTGPAPIAAAYLPLALLALRRLVRA